MSLNNGLTKILSLKGFNGNRELNLFCAARFIRSVGNELIGLFIPIYFYKLGYPIHLIILFYWLWAFTYTAFIYRGAKVISKLGLKRSMLMATFLRISLFIGLRQVFSLPALFYILPFVYAWDCLLDDLPYHLIFLRNSEKVNRGKQLSLVRAIVLLGAMFAPAAGGFLAYYSFGLLYAVGAVILAISALPLFLTKEIHEEIRFEFSDIYKEVFSWKNRYLTLSYVSYAVEYIIDLMLWPIFIFIILGTAKETGMAVSLSAVLGFVVLFIAGKLADGWSKIRLLQIGSILYTLGWLGRIFARSYSRIIAIDSFKQLSRKLLGIPWSAFSYDVASQRNALLFYCYQEVIFKLTRVLVLPLLILLFYIRPNSFEIAFVAAAVCGLGYMFMVKEISVSKRELKGKLI